MNDTDLLKYLRGYYFSKDTMSNFKDIGFAVTSSGINNGTNIDLSNNKNFEVIDTTSLVDILYTSLYEYIYSPSDNFDGVIRKLRTDEITADVQFAFRSVDLQVLADYPKYHTLLETSQKKIDNELKKICGGLGELILFNIMKDIYKSLPVLHRVNLKSSRNDEVKDLDSLHFSFDIGKFYLGESKLILPTSTTVTLANRIRSSISECIDRFLNGDTSTLINKSVVFEGSADLKLNLRRHYRKLQNDPLTYKKDWIITSLVIMSKNTISDIKLNSETNLSVISRSTLESYFSNHRTGLESLISNVDLFVIYIEDLLEVMYKFMEGIESYDGSTEKIGLL